MTDPKCKHCNGEMKPGKAFQSTFNSGMPDFPGDKNVVTLSPGGPGKLIDCLKCSNCGWSTTSTFSALTDERILIQAHRIATKYTHKAPVTDTKFGFSERHLLEFVRTVLAIEKEIRG